MITFSDHFHDAAIRHGFKRTRQITNFAASHCSQRRDRFTLTYGYFKLTTFGRQAEQVGARRDGGDKVFTGLRGVGFEFGFIHVLANAPLS